MQTNATRHLAAALVPGVATPTMAKMNMHTLWVTVPTIRMTRRETYLIRKKELRDPAMPHMLEMTVMRKGSFTPEREKK